MVCWRRDGLGLATSTTRRPLRSLPPLGRASFLPGRVGKRVISGEAVLAPEKMKHVRTRGFVVASRFEAAGAVDGWLDDRREAGAAPTVGAVVDLLADGLDYLFERLDCHARRESGLTCNSHTWSGPREPARPKRPYVP